MSGPHRCHRKAWSLDRIVNFINGGEGHFVRSLDGRQDDHSGAVLCLFSASRVNRLWSWSLFVNYRNDEHREHTVRSQVDSRQVGLLGPDPYCRVLTADVMLCYLVGCFRASGTE